MLAYLTKLEELRVALLSTIAPLTTQQLNDIPRGFNNNIIWNMGHMLVISEDILYAGITTKRPRHEFATSVFSKGSRPEQDIDAITIAAIQKSLAETAPAFSELLKQASLAHPALQYDKVVRSIISNASMNFLIFHEQMHIRVIDQLILQLH